MEIARVGETDEEGDLGDRQPIVDLGEAALQRSA